MHNGIRIHLKKSLGPLLKSSQ